MKQRILTSALIVAVLVLMFFTRVASTYIFDIFLGMIIIFAALEFSKILSNMGLANHAYLIGLYPTFAYCGYMTCLLSNSSLLVFLLTQFAIIFLSVLCSFLYTISSKKQTDEEMKLRGISTSTAMFSFQKAINTLFGFIYPTIFMMLLILINHIEEYSVIFPKGNIANLGYFALIFAFLIPILTDTFAFLTGSLIGGKKLFPKVSPHKTISGAIGGFVWTILICATLFILLENVSSINSIFTALNLKWYHIAIASGIGSIVSQFGDLFESWVKRRAGVKDSGDIFPGHGGFLDRFDSHITNALVMFIFFLILV